MNEHIAALRQILADSKPLWGGRIFIDEERFYIATVSLRKMLPATLSLSPRLFNGPDALSCIDALDAVIERGHCRLFGKVLVSPAEIEPLIQQLEAALSTPARFQPTNLPRLDVYSPSIETAKLEAARIIEEAHREADAIRRRAHENPRDL